MDDDFWEPSRAQVWRQDTVNSALAAARGEVRRLGLERALARSRRKRGANAASLRSELARFAFATAALELAVEQGPSQHRSVRALCREAARSLRRVGIGRRGSRLSYLHDKLVEMASAVATPAAAPSGLEAEDVASASLGNLIEGGADPSLRLLESALARTSPLTDRASLQMAGARVARISGRFDLARSWLDRIGSDQLVEECAWERTCLVAMESGSATEIIRSLRTGSATRSSPRMLEASLWTRASPAKTLMSELPAPSSLRRVARGEGDPVAWRVALVLERAHKTSLPLQARVASVLRALDVVDEIVDPALLLLATAACARWLLRFKQGAEGARAVARYRGYCLSLSDGQTTDVYRLALDGEGALSRPDPSPERPSVLRLGFELLRARLRAHPSTDEEVQDYLEILAHHLSVLKGPLMKLGQMLAFYGVPMSDDSRDLLAALHDDAVPLPFACIRGVIEAELEHPIDAMFAELDEVPISAASVGQVHRGLRLDGEPVAIKVQYPDIARRMERDFRAIRLLLPIARGLLPPWDLDRIVSEVHERMLLECDFRHEARWQSTFRARFEGDPTVHVPRVHEDLSTARVLTTSFFEGQTFAEFVASASHARRRVAADAILRYAIRTTIVDRSINTDMHPGNLLFSEDRVCVVDFGNIREWSTESAWGWREMVGGVLTGEQERLVAGFKLLGFLPSATDRTIESTSQILLRFLSKILRDEAPCRISKADLLGELAPLAPTGPLVAAGLQMPPDFVYTFRMYWGLLAILADMNVEVSFRRISVEELGLG
jgi:predicted unusual protein kinase regulating ubiquinone biosynthesis (AarF/ABC1/UbiB family)